MKKVLSVFLSVLISVSAVCSFPFSAMAAVEGEIGEIENPIYSGASIELPNMKLRSNLWMKDTAYQLKDYMISRSTDSFAYSMPSRVLSNGELADEIAELVMYACSQEISTGAVDGDYLYYQLSGIRDINFFYNYSTGAYDIELKVKMRTSAQDERAVDAAVDTILSSVNMNAVSDYEILRIFHDYVLNACEYNYADMDNEYNYTGYGVFSRGKAVCQGYALAFYRLCMEAGFDCRIVASDPDVGCHAWNLVYIGDAYYFVDCTWDDELDNPYEFFLVDYDTIRSEDDYSYAHELYGEMYDEDTYFNCVYRPNITAKDWNTSSKSISNCVINVDTANIYNTAVVFNGIPLSVGVDYTVSGGSDCFVEVNGAGEFAGSSSKRSRSISAVNPVLEYTSVLFDGYRKTPSVYIAGLTQNVDYIVHYSENVNAGEANVLITGTGAYKGHKTVSFTILRADINSFPIQLGFTQTVYTGYSQMPSVTINGLRQGIDYTVECTPIKEVGTGYIYIKGINNCYSSAVRTYEIFKRNIGECAISLSSYSYIYNGNAKKPNVYIQGLTQGTDYSVSYSNNVYPGKATVHITGTNYYDGTTSVDFYILPNKVSVSSSASTSTVTLNFGKQSGIGGYIVDRFTGGSWKQAAVLPGTDLSYTDRGLNSGQNRKYRVRAYVVIDGKTYTSEENIVSVKTKGPAKASLSSVKAGKKSFTVNWKKQSCSGYLIQYSTSSSFKKAKTVKVSSKTKSKKIVSLKKNKKYYVRVRAYNTVKGKKIYGTWSSKKSVKTK